MNTKIILDQVRENLASVIAQDSARGVALWKELLALHAADIADFLTHLSREQFKQIFEQFSIKQKYAAFEELSDPMRLYSLSCMKDEETVELLNMLPADELTDLFDQVPEDELKKYLALLRKDVQSRVLSLLKFHPESAGGIMNTEALSVIETMSVAQCVGILKQLQSMRDVYQILYVTDRANILVGHIALEDLVLYDSDARIGSIMRENQLVVVAQEDRESVAKKMVHYGLATVPVVDEAHHLLGIIPSLTLMDVLVEEASEDVQKMSALAPMKESYFDTSFLRLLYERSRILIVLLLAGSFTTTIMRAYESTLEIGFLLYFASMLTSTGGNTSSQTSAMVIQGLALGDIQPSNMFRFLRREFLMACMIGGILGLTAFLRVYVTTDDHLQAFAISLSLAVIVIVSVVFGSCIPLVLRRFNIDPAFSAGPFLATLMDILGALIYCYVARLILS
jgi:magnesium transporter